MSKIVRFQDGQMIRVDRVTGLTKYMRYDDGVFVVMVLGLDSNIAFEFDNEADQEEHLKNISSQLAPHLDLVEFSDLDLTDRVREEKLN